MKVKVNIFLYVVYRYLYTHTQPTNNAIYNTQKYVYLYPTMMTMKLNNKDIATQEYVQLMISQAIGQILASAY